MHVLDFTYCVEQRGFEGFQIENILFADLVGCEPKPQHLERTRVVGVKPEVNHYKNGHRNRHEHHSKEQKKVGDKLDTFKLWDDGPNFDTNLRQNVVALVGRTAYLTCRVFDRGNKTVKAFLSIYDFQLQELSSLGVGLSLVVMPPF